jgi:hypothetical protein
MDLSHYGLMLGMIATAISIIVGYGTIKQRRNEPHEIHLKELAAWQASVDAKLDNDKRALNKLQREMDEYSGFQQITLKSLKGVIGYLAIANPGDKHFTDIIAEIDEFLIKR